MHVLRHRFHAVPIQHVSKRRVHGRTDRIMRIAAAANFRCQLTADTPPHACRFRQRKGRANRPSGGAETASKIEFYGSVEAQFFRPFVGLNRRAAAAAAAGASHSTLYIVMNGHRRVGFASRPASVGASQSARRTRSVSAPVSCCRF